MKTAVVFYSWSGRTKALAQARAEQEGAPLFEVTDIRRPGTLKAYTVCCFLAMRMKGTPISPLPPLDGYDRLILMSPVWAGHPAPAMNAVLHALPAGKEVEVVMVSGSGGSSCRKSVAALVESKGCTLTGFGDIRG